MSGPYKQDIEEVKTATELLKSQASEQVKQHIVFDSADRPVLVFTAPIGTEDGKPCTATEYVYRNSTSTQVKDRQERVYKWKAIWDSNFIFNPLTSYDSDGDGIL
jgi:hypothetical protein